MTTLIKPKLSKRNEYYLEKHRYYELKHFCLQYLNWKREYDNLDGYSSNLIDGMPRSFGISNKTATYAEKRVLCFNNMMKVEQAALESDGDLASYILKAVTEGHSYNYLRTVLNIPCSRDIYYNRYRRFFWLLDKVRD